jgi:transcriptional regulator with GAF, ATPase, and Fis domain
VKTQSVVWLDPRGAIRAADAQSGISTRVEVITMDGFPTMAPDPVMPVVTQARLDFEALVVETSAALMGAAVGEVDAAVEGALERLRAFFDVDRAGLLTVGDDRTTVRITHEAYGPGVAHVPATMELERLFPWSHRRAVIEQQPVVVPRVTDLPAEAATDRATWTHLGAHSNLTVPVVSGTAVTHLVSMGAIGRQRDWPIDYIPRIRLLGEMMVAAIRRARAIVALASREAEVQEKASRLEAAAEAAGLGFLEFVIGDEPPRADARVRELLGLDAPDERRLGEIWLSRIGAEALALVHEQRRQLLAGELDRSTVEYRYDHPRRGWIWLRQAARRLPQADHHGPHLMATVQDITESRLREEALHAAHDELKQLRDRLERENVYLRRQVTPPRGLDIISGRSQAIRRALEFAAQVAPTSSTVLLVGETGTGKERFAEYIHQQSPRRSSHMVRVNCSAIPAALIESELFGREKGAYTGALTRQIGRFELANGSTLLLDEIGDLPLDVQVKLLRVLQERTLERLGSPTPLPVDVRIIAATNHDLQAAVRAGTFRSDLFYRLNVFPIAVPPLRERRDDLPMLVEALVEELGSAIRKRFTSVDRASLDGLAGYDWPGNVRELRNVLERAMILSPGPVLKVEVPGASTPARAPAAAAPAPPPVDRGASAGGLRAWEREEILRVLNETGWRIRGPRGAATVLDLKPTTLEKRMARLGIRRPSAIG